MGDFMATPVGHEALVILALITVTAILGVCAWRAWLLEDWFSRFDIEDYRPRGRPATRPSGLDSTLKKALNHFWTQLLPFIGRFAALFFFAVIVPTGLLYAAVQKYDWLAPGHVGFSIEGRSTQVLSTSERNQFLTSQFTKGTLLDTVEVFDVNMSTVDYRREDLPITLAIFVYRLFVGLFSAGFFLSLLRLTVLVARKTPGIRKLKWRRSIGGQINRGQPPA